MWTEPPTAKGFEAGIVLTSPNGTIIEQSYSFVIKSTNNEAKYEAFFVGLKKRMPSASED